MRINIISLPLPQSLLELKHLILLIISKNKNKKLFQALPETVFDRFLKGMAYIFDEKTVLATNDR